MLDAFRQEARGWLDANFPRSLKGVDNMMSTIEGPTDLNADERAWKAAMGD